MKKKTLFQSAVQKILTMSGVSFIQSPTSGFEADDASDLVLQTTYQNSLYVNRALEFVQDAVSDVDFKLYQIVKSDGTAEEVVVSDIIDLLYKPNPIQTKSEFWRVVAINFKLSGESFIRVMRDARSGKPTMLVNLNSKDMEVELTEDGEVKYRYSNSKGEQINLASTDVIHIKNPNPNSPLRGFSPLRPMLSRIEAEIKTVEYQTQLYGHNGNPDGILTVKGVSDKGILQTIKQGFYNSFRGKNESNRIAVVGGEASYTPLNSSSNTLDYIAGSNHLRDEIFMALGVPKALATSDDVNRANADAGLQQFLQFTIAPMFRLFLEVLNERFVIPNYGEEWYLDTNKIVSEDRGQLLEESKAGVNKWLLPNEVRERFGYEPMEGGDVLNTGNTYQFAPQGAPVLQNALKTRPSLYKKLYHTEKFKAFRAKKALQKMTSDPVFKVKFSGAMESVRAKGERIMDKESRKFFKEQLGRVLTKLKEVGDNANTGSDIFNHQKEAEEAYKYVLPVYTNIAVQAGNVALSPTEIITGKANNFVMNSVLFKKLEQRAKLFSGGITDNTFEAISIIVADKMSEGVGAIETALREKFAEFSPVRAERIARTEAGYMTSLGSEMAYQESEVVEGKEWLTTGDERVREEHVQNDGEVVGKYDAFSNGEHFPAEASINCRCTIAPVVRV